MRAAKAICERALAFLDEQRLPPTPSNYRLAFALFDGAHAALEKAVGEIVEGGVRVTQSQADALGERFLGQAPQRGPVAVAVTVADETADAVRHQALRLIDLGKAATEATGDFGRELASSLPDIGAADTDSLRELVVAMVERSQRAERELAATTAEVGRLRQKLEAVQGDAERDMLTGLPNRRGIDAYLATLRDAEDPIVIALCDVDNFKSYNDRYGHAVGDRVLKTVARSLAESLPGQFVGRWGGEEFLVVARADVGAGVALIEDAKTELGARHFKLRETDQPMGRISFSAGVTALPRATDELGAALERADALLYRAKSEGRDRVIGG